LERKVKEAATASCGSANNSRPRRRVVSFSEEIVDKIEAEHVILRFLKRHTFMSRSLKIK
jgi:hypothetical protein